MSLAASTTTENQPRRTRIEGDRVACARIGSVDLDRCRECTYLVRMEDADVSEPGATYVICADAAPDAEIPFAW